MSEAKGLLVTCHRCGATIFLKYLKTEAFDGGYTHMDNFESKPEGWTRLAPDVDGIGKTDLCPECTDIFFERLESFYNKK